MRLIAAFGIVAHAGEAHQLHWSFEPWTIAILFITGALYAAGAARMKVRLWQTIAFVLGWLTLVIALLSPLDELSEILFSAHMAQHELLIIVAAPLIVFGRPLIAFVWALPVSWRLRIGGWCQAAPVAKTWRIISGPLVVTILHALALWVWHLPSLYQATLGNDVIHAAQHLSFLLTAALFWWALIHGRYGRMGYGVAVVYVFVTAAHSGILGALIALSPNVIYPIYQHSSAQWGINALDDQQLAGILMWIPAGVAFTIVGVALFAAWLGEAERRVKLTKADTLSNGGQPPSAVPGSRLAKNLPFTLLLLFLSFCSKPQERYQTGVVTGGGNPNRGRQLVDQYGCSACHAVPGISGAKGMVGPPLDHIGSRSYIAGKFPNRPDVMMRWLQNPQQMDPNNAMPNLGISAADSRDIAAYLYTLQ